MRSIKNQWSKKDRVGPGVSPASPWARATPHHRATKMEKKKKKKNCIHKIKFLLEGKKYIQKILS